MDFEPVDLQIATNSVREAQQAIEKLEKQPDVDLFKDFA
jgi:hypothetical protein